MISAYQGLLRDVSLIEAVSYESANLERTVFQVDVKKSTPGTLL